MANEAKLEHVSLMVVTEGPRLSLLEHVSLMVVWGEATASGAEEKLAGLSLAPNNLAPSNLAGVST